MRFSFKRYLLWVLVPTTLGMLGVLNLFERGVESRRGETIQRLGGMATLLFLEEMGARSQEMVRAAPLLPDPDLESPVLRAASMGDTVVALGTRGDALVLSVAFAVEDGGLEPPAAGEVAHGSSPGIRAITEPFGPSSLDLFHARTGNGAALYLRGRRVVASPPDFGPPSVEAWNHLEPFSAPAPRAVLLPLSQPGARTATGSLHPAADLLVGWPSSRQPPPSSGGGFGCILLPLILGIVSWGLLAAPGSARPAGIRQGATRSGAATSFVLGSRGSRQIRLLALIVLPLGTFWTLLLGYGRESSARAGTLLRGDLVRVLSLVTAGPMELEPADVAQRTGFEAVRTDQAGILDSTLPSGPLLAQAMAISPPPPDLPVHGTLRDGGRSWAYVAAREGGDRRILFLAPLAPSIPGTFTSQLAVAGSLVSLLSVVFLTGERRRAELPHPQPG